jgi:hypothetical protein
MLDPATAPSRARTPTPGQTIRTEHDVTSDGDTGDQHDQHDQQQGEQAATPGPDAPPAVLSPGDGDAPDVPDAGAVYPDEHGVPGAPEA